MERELNPALSLGKLALFWEVPTIVLRQFNRLSIIINGTAKPTASCRSNSFVK
jgi:hypothetical protein